MKKLVKVLLIAGFALLFVLVGGLYAVLRQPTIKSVDVSQNSWLPVPVYVRGKFSGNATMRVSPEGKPLALVTAAHVISTSPISLYEWKLVRSDGTYAEHGYARGFSSKCIPTLKSNIYADVAYCGLGFSPSGLVVPDEMWRELSDRPNLTGDSVPVPLRVRSGFSGREAKVAGFFVVDERLYFVILYEAESGESGESFFDPKSGALLVLNGTLPASDQFRENFRVPPDMSRITLATPVHFNMKRERG